MSRLAEVSVRRKWALGATVMVLLAGVTGAVIVAEHTSTTSTGRSAVEASSPTPATTPSPSGARSLTSEQKSELAQSIGRMRLVVPVTAAASPQYPAVSAEARRQPDLYAAAFVRQLLTQDYRVTRDVLLSWVQSESAQSTDPLVVGLTPVDLRNRILDEAANYPLPSLPSLMSEGGGTGITTMVVLQSLAQARAVWGEHETSAIWDAAIVKLILGGGSNARDLEDLSKLIGQRQERQYAESVGADGRRSRSLSLREILVMDTFRLWMLPFGTAVMMLRAARPIVLSMTAWTQRPDAAELQRSRRRLEKVIEHASSPPQPPPVS